MSRLSLLLCCSGKKLALEHCICFCRISFLADAVSVIVFFFFFNRYLSYVEPSMICKQRVSGEEEGRENARSIILKRGQDVVFSISILACVAENRRLVNCDYSCFHHYTPVTHNQGYGVGLDDIPWKSPIFFPLLSACQLLYLILCQESEYLIIRYFLYDLVLN